MQQGDKVIAEAATIEEILRTGTTCQLAFSTVPVPYIVTLNYGYHDGALYFHGASEGHKIDLIRKHGQAAFTVVLDHGVITGENACDWSARFQSVVGFGDVILFESAEEKQQGLDRLMAHYSNETFRYPDKMVQATAVFKLVVTGITVKQSDMDI